MKKFLSAALLALLAVSLFAVPSEAARRKTNRYNSHAYCDSYARDVANRRAGAQQVLGGAAIGAATGAVVGAIVGGHHSVGTGALVGGAAGTVGGGITANSKWHNVYRTKYNNCRSRR